MLSYSLALLLAQALPVQAVPVVTDQVLEQLASNESRLPGRLKDVIFEDPAMRKEIRRVGFEKGCRAMAESRREVSQRYNAALIPATVAAIRKFVPEPQLSLMRPRSFVTGPLTIYKARIEGEIDRSAPAILAAAYSAMRDAFLKRTKTYPSQTQPAGNIVMPKPDLAVAVGMTGPYNLDDPAHLSMACIELLISPDKRPKITTEPRSAPSVIIPSK